MRLAALPAPPVRMCCVLGKWTKSYVELRRPDAGVQRYYVAGLCAHARDRVSPPIGLLIVGFSRVLPSIVSFLSHSLDQIEAPAPRKRSGLYSAFHRWTDFT